MFRESNGMFSEVKFVLLIRAALNIGLSIAFGFLCGVFGIFLATAVSLLLTNFWIEPRIISKNIFCRAQSAYWLKQLKYFSLTVVSFVACYFATTFLGDSILMLVAKAVIICAIVALVFVISNCKTSEFKKLKCYLTRK